MATTTDLTTITEDEARMRAFQIIGSDIGAAAVFNGDWHEALKTAADLMASTAPTTTHPAPAA